jgi:hypothetical protein
VAQLGEDRVVDLSRVEAFRLKKLGEGRAEVLAEALVPPSLRLLLESGPRALLRARQAFAYAEKWARRGDLPETLAPRREAVRLQPCLPRPAALRTDGGLILDRLAVRGPGAALAHPPSPTIAVVGQAGGRIGGWCLALEHGGGAVLGGWLTLEFRAKGHLEMLCGQQRRSAPFDAWEDLELPELRPAEVCLLPPPRWKPLPETGAPRALELRTPWEMLPLRLEALGTIH